MGPRHPFLPPSLLPPGFGGAPCPCAALRGEPSAPSADSAPGAVRLLGTRATPSLPLKAGWPRAVRDSRRRLA